MPGQENIRTSLSKPLQQQLETIAHQAQNRLSKDRRKTLALLVVANQGRKILAHIGSGDFWSNRIDLTRARRSPGSTLKPFIYGLAFEQGFLHPETRILDRPTRFGSYGPGNFDGYYQGCTEYGIFHLSGFLPGDHQGAHRGIHLRKDR